MKKFFKRSILLASILFLMMSILPMGNEVNATTMQYYSTWKSNSAALGFSNFTGMQGMCIDKSTNTVYCAKINTNNFEKKAQAVLYKINLSTKKDSYLYNGSNKIYTSKSGVGFYHTNDMEFVKIDKTKYIYLATLDNRSTYQIIRLKLNGNKYTIDKKYKVKYNGKEVNIAALALINQSGNNLNFFMKSGRKLYKATFSKTLKSGSTINLDKQACSLNLAKSKVKGKVIPNINEFSGQGMHYYKGRLYTPFTKGNVSVIFVFSVDGTKTLPSELIGLDDISFRVTSKTYGKLFEIESCGIGKDGKMYFNFNGQKNDKTKKSEDKIGYFENFNAQN